MTATKPSTSSRVDRRQQDAARARQLLHPPREMGRLADRRVVHVEIAADGAHDDLARVEPDPDLHVHAVRAARLLRVAHHQLLHPQRRIARPHGVVLVGERRAEQRHDPVAHDLVDRALVAVDRFHHVLEHRIEELARLLGIAVGEQFHRALQVGEQHGDLLALAFQGGLGGEDLLGQMLRGVGLGGGQAWPVGIGPSGAAHWPQNLFSGGFPAPQDGQVEASGAAHSPQNFVPVEFSCWQRGHCMPEPPRDARTGARELGGSLGGPAGRVKASMAQPTRPDPGRPAPGLTAYSYPT